MKIISAAAGALALSIPNIFAGSQDDAFQKIAHDYIEQYLRTNPENATNLGGHRFDGELTDYSAGARAKDLATQKKFRDELSTVDGSQLTGPNNVDFRILKENIDYQIFRSEELKEPDWNPLVYMQSLANSLYLVLARDFAPPEKRIPSLRERMEKIPRVIAQAKANLQHPPRVHTETAIEQTQGAINLVRREVSVLLDQASPMKNDLAPLQEKTAAALEDYEKWLQNDLLPRSDGNFRLGADKYRKKLRFALTSDLSMEQIMKRAQADLQQTQSAIYETALPLYKKYFPTADDKTLADKHKVVAGVLDKLAEQHPDDATIVGFAKAVVVEATSFVRQHDLVTVPNVPLDVIAMPEFKRGVAIAYCDADSEKLEFGGVNNTDPLAASRSKLVIASYNIRYARGRYLISGGLFRKVGLLNSANRPQLVSSHIKAAANAFSSGRLLPKVNILALQEADKRTARSGRHHVANELADALHMSWVHVPAGIPRGIKPATRQWWLEFAEPIDLHDTGDTGIALLSHLPVSEVIRIDFLWHECPWLPGFAMDAG